MVREEGSLRPRFRDVLGRQLETEISSFGIPDPDHFGVFPVFQHLLVDNSVDGRRCVVQAAHKTRQVDIFQSA